MALGIGFAVIPVAAGVAILRYRLYDIDVVINRTLVYGSLTATLAGVYVGSVLLLQLALEWPHPGLGPGGRRLDPGGRRPLPARPGPHPETVDRRFFRSRYDATQTLEAFGARLRDEVDLEALSAELRGGRRRDDAARPCLALAAVAGSVDHERDRTVKRLAWGLVALALALMVASTVVALTGGDRWEPRQTPSSGGSRSSSRSLVT